MSEERRLVVPASVVFREVAGEAVILDLETQRYFSLDETGTRMWSLLAEHGRLEPVRERLLGEYEVDSERLERDLGELVERLVAEGLVRWSAAGAGEEGPDPPPGPHGGEDGEADSGG